MKYSRKVIEVGVAVSEAAYSAGDQVGALITFADAVEAAGAAALVESLTLVDTEKQAPAMVLHLFSRAPTLAGDNNANTFVDAEMNYYLGRIDIASGDWLALANQSVVTLKNIGLCIQAEDRKSGTNVKQDIYGVLTTSGTPDWTAGTRLRVRLGVSR